MHNLATAEGGSGEPFNRQGNYSVWSYRGRGDVPVGQLRSATFVLGGTGSIDLLVGGGGNVNLTYVALVRAADGAELFKASGLYSETMRRVAWDAAAYVGQALYIKVVDRSSDGWGHINVDDVNVPVGSFPALGASHPGSDLEGPGKGLSVAFNQEVSYSLGAGDLRVTDLATGQVLPAARGVRFDPATFTAHFDFDVPLPDGNYRATLAAGSVADAAGNLLAADFAFEFFVLAGDANRDRAVDFRDLVVLAQNYNAVGKNFTQGDFNGDGRVDFNDLVVLAQRYNTTLPAPAPVAVAPAASAVGAGRRGAPARKPAAVVPLPVAPVAPVFATSTRIRPATVFR